MKWKCSDLKNRMNRIVHKAHLFRQNLSLASPYGTWMILRTLETTYDRPPTNWLTSRISLPSGNVKMYLTPAVVGIFSLSQTNNVSNVKNALLLTDVLRPCTHSTQNHVTFHWACAVMAEEADKFPSKFYVILLSYSYEIYTPLTSCRCFSSRDTRKHGNHECIATWGRPSHGSPFPL